MAIAYEFPPVLAAVRAYLRVPATALTDDELQLMIDATSADQSARCDWGQDDNPAADYPAPLYQGLMRRIQREVAARNLPLGMVGMEAEYGPQRIPALDALVEHHEHAYRRAVLS